MVPDLLSEQEAHQLIQYSRTHKHLRSIGDGSDYTAIDKIHIHTQWVRNLINRIDFTVVSEIHKVTGQLVFPEQCILTEWEIGGFQEPHLDTYSNVELDNLSPEDIKHLEANPSREWTLILNINNNFGSGQTFFPPTEVNPIKYTHNPVARQGVIFQGIYHPHGVNKVRRNSRHTLSTWYSSNDANMIPDATTKDLNMNHLSFPKTLK